VEDDPGAPFFNDTTKYVVSATLTDATWRNSKIVGPYDPDTIRRLKDEVDGDLYVSGSGTLVRAMLADGLVDELHLFVYPLTRGSGPRLLPEGAAPTKLSLAASEAYENGVVYLAYRPQA
jgi:dihydrofolate reductase